MNQTRPVVLCLSGHDPGGGAGIQADAETVAALGAHALSVITAHTVQDSRDVARVVAPDPTLLREQLDALLADFRIDAVKIGLLAGRATVDIVVRTLERLDVPAVLDPVLRAGGGAELENPLLDPAMQRALFARVEVITPNAAEARRLGGQDDLDACATALIGHGARHVLITGGDEPGDVVMNRFYMPHRAVRCFPWPRLAGAFHGAGCTLAAAIAAFRARGVPLPAAVAEAQSFTHRALAHAHAAGSGRLIPGRVVRP